MKAIPVLISVFLGGVLAAFGQFHDPGLRPGLEVNEYPRTDTQTSAGEAFVESVDLGDPIGEAYLVPNLEGWKYTTQRNAVAKGTLRIPETGEYRFISNSYYDRNVLKIAGEVVCGFRDGESTVGIVTLEEGTVPIESIGYVDARGGAHGVTVKWKPPGQREFSEIPADRLLHKPRLGLKLRKDDEAVVTQTAMPAPNLRATSMTVVAKDFVIEAYHNGV